MYQPVSEKWGGKQTPLSKMGQVGKYQHRPAIPVPPTKTVSNKNQKSNKLANKSNYKGTQNPMKQLAFKPTILQQSNDDAFVTSDELIEMTAHEIGYEILNPYIPHDGSCFYESVSSALQAINYPNHAQYSDLRKSTVEYLKQNRFCGAASESYSALISPNYYQAKMQNAGKNFDDLEERWAFYLEDMSKQHTYADEVILRATSEFLKISVKVITTDKEPVMYFYTSSTPSIFPPIVLGVHNVSVNGIDTGHYMPLQRSGTIPISLQKVHRTLINNLTEKKNVEIVTLYECLHYLSQHEKDEALAQENRIVLSKIQDSLAEHGFTLPVQLWINESNGDCKIGVGKYTLMAALAKKTNWIPAKITKKIFYEDDSQKVFYFDTKKISTVPTEFFGFPIVSDKSLNILDSPNSKDSNFSHCNTPEKGTRSSFEAESTAQHGDSGKNY